MPLLGYIPYTCLLTVVVFKLLKELFLIGLVNNVAEVRLEWIICTED